MKRALLVCLCWSLLCWSLLCWWFFVPSLIHRGWSFVDVEKIERSDVVYITVSRGPHSCRVSLGRQFDGAEKLIGERLFVWNWMWLSRDGSTSWYVSQGEVISEAAEKIQELRSWRTEKGAVTHE